MLSQRRPRRHGELRSARDIRRRMRRQNQQTSPIQMKRHLIDALVKRHKALPPRPNAVPKRLRRSLVDLRRFLILLPKHQAALGDRMEWPVGKGTHDNGHIRIPKVADDVAFLRSACDEPDLAARADDPSGLCS